MRQTKQVLTLSYPTFAWGLGVVLFYLQVAFHWWSLNSRLSVGLLKVLAGGILFFGVWVGINSSIRLGRQTLQELESKRAGWFGISALIVVFIFCFFFGFKPVHLIQESDFINYHLFLPKQAWLWGSWSPLLGHPYEFLSLMVQYGLSYFWMAFPTLNRFPQFLFFWFLCLNIWSVTSFFDAKTGFKKGFIAVLLFLSFRGVFIQMGTGMLDLTNLYFAVSGLNLTLAFGSNAKLKPVEKVLYSSLLGVNLAAYLAHKSFGFILFGVFFLSGLFAVKRFLDIKLARVLTPFRSMSLWIPLFIFWVPNLVRSYLFTGDPFFPIFPSLTRLGCESGKTVLNCSEMLSWVRWHHSSLNHYGYGHDVGSFLKAVFLLGFAIPGTVNNAYDYPLGLAWPLTLAVLGAALFRPLLRNQAKVILFPLAGFFLIWFLGSQQEK